MRSRAVLLAVALVVTGLAGSVGVSEPGAAEPPAPDRLVSPNGSSHVWPYTSQSRSVSGRTLALNVVVYGDPWRVRRALTDRTDANWSVVDRDDMRVSPWRPAHGSVRYTYVTSNPNGTGRWVVPDYQLDVGTYLGQRTHVRAYDSPSGNWTALQAHTEYWDWFRLRHTVTGVATGARFLERDLQGEPFVERISRPEHESGRSDGRWTVVDLTPAVLFVGVAIPLTSRRWTARDITLPVALLGLVLGVRIWGLAAETALPGVNPKLFVAVGYPVLVVGPPVLVTALARDRPAVPLAILAAAGLGTGLFLDLAVVGVGHVPDHVAFHRVALVAALGTLALGTGRGDRRVVGVGVVTWGVVLAAPLLGVV